jgi:hypothetical protein
MASEFHPNSSQVLYLPRSTVTPLSQAAWVLQFAVDRRSQNEGVLHYWTPKQSDTSSAIHVPVDRSINSSNDVFFIENHLRCVIYIDADSGMFGMLDNGSIGFDAVLIKIDSILADLATAGNRDSSVTYVIVCLQYSDAGATRIILEGYLSELIGKIKTSISREAAQGSISGSPSMINELIELDVTLSYCVQLLNIAPINGRNAILYFTCGYKHIDIPASIRVLAKSQTTLHIILFPSTSCRFSDSAGLTAVAASSAGSVFIDSSVGGHVADQIIRRALYTKKYIQPRSELRYSMRLAVYDVPASIFPVVVARRLQDGFVIVYMNSEKNVPPEPKKGAGRNKSRGKSYCTIHLIMQFMFSKMSSIFVEIDCVRYAINFKSSKSGNDLPSRNASMNDYSMRIQVFSKHPDHWSAAKVNEILDLQSTFSLRLQSQDMSLASTLTKLSVVFGGGLHSHAESDAALFESTIPHHYGLRKTHSLVEEKQLKTPMGSGDDLHRKGILNELAALQSAIEEIAALNVISQTEVYVRELNLLTDLNKSPRFRSACVNEFTHLLGGEWDPFEISPLKWILVRRTQSSDPSCFSNFIVISLTHVHGVFVEVVVSHLFLDYDFNSSLYSKLTSVPTGIASALGAVGYRAMPLQRNLSDLLIHGAERVLSRALHMGRLSHVHSVYALDLGDPMMLGSLVADICSAKAAVGFQIASHSGGQVVDIRFCSVFPALIGGVSSVSLLQCSVECRSSGVAVSYHWEREESVQQADIGSFTARLCLQDQRLTDLYRALISTFSQLSNGANATPIRIDVNGWDSFRRNSDVFKMLLPALSNSESSQDETESTELMAMLTTSLKSSGKYCPVDVSGLANQNSSVLCMRVDLETVLLLELHDALQGSSSVELPELSSTDSTGEAARRTTTTLSFSRTTMIEMRLFAVPLLRRSIDPDLLSYAERLSIPCPPQDLPGAQGGGPPQAGAEPLAAPVLVRDISSRLTKILQGVQDAVMKYHLLNYAVSLYSMVSSRRYIPTRAELAAAMHSCTQLSHELDISTVCNSKRLILTHVGSSDILSSITRSFNCTIGKHLAVVPGSEYFVYSPVSSDKARVPMFVKFSYVLMSQAASHASEPGMISRTDADAAYMEDGESVCLLEPAQAVEVSAPESNIAEEIFNLVMGKLPNGDAARDASNDVVMRVDFIYPRLIGSSAAEPSGGGRGGATPAAVSSSQSSLAAATAAVPQSAFSDLAKLLSSELHVFVALDILGSLCVVENPSAETLVLVQHCLRTVPHVRSRIVSLDVLAPVSLRTQQALPETAIPKIISILERIISATLTATKIGD